MKIFLMAYVRMNLGDDLFIKILLEKYKEHDFYIRTKNHDYLQYFSAYKNLHISVGNDSVKEICMMDVEEYDAYVYIGGSIFMEGKTGLSNDFCNFLQRCKEKHKPFCYISSNYGPYKTKDYLELSKKAFSTCYDICFRDTYSYTLFQDIHSVRYAPDVVFSYPVHSQENIPNSVGISVINLENRDNLKHLDSKYDSFLLHTIQHFLQVGKKVYLYSFCKYEGDEIAIDRIMEHFVDNPNVIPCKYDGNIDTFLDTYSKMERMLATRFHSMVLSSIFRQKVFVLSYSHKIDTVWNDLHLGYDILHLEELHENYFVPETGFKVVDEENILKISRDAKNQLKALDSLH